MAVEVDCWGTLVRLPEGCSVIEQEKPSNIVQVRIGEGIHITLGALRVEYELVFDIEDGILFIQRPSSSPLQVFGMQFHNYVIRMGLGSRFGTSGPGFLLRLQGKNTCLCSDYTIYDKASYEEKLREARQAGKSIAEGVRSLFNLEFHVNNKDAEAAVKWQARATQRMAVGMVPSSGAVYMAWWCENGGRLVTKCEINPRSIKVVVPELPLLEFFLVEVANSPVWPHPYHHPHKELPYLPKRILGELCVRSIRNEDFDMFREVINYVDGADLLMDPATGKMALQVALEEHLRKESPAPGKVVKSQSVFVQYLLQNGANPRRKGFNGIWAMLYAKAKKLEGDYYSLLKAAASHDYYAVYTPEDAAKIRANTEGIDTKDLHADDLRKAVVAGNVQLAELLLDLGINPNQLCDKQHALPLVIIAMTGEACSRQEMVTTLLLHGADPTMKDGLGRTALQLARKLDVEPELAAMLETHVKRNRGQT